MLDQENAHVLASQLHIDVFTVYREYLQLIFLKYFYKEKFTEKVYFKGGTSLHFLFGSFRFSEDLDFTSLISKKELQKLVTNTMRAIGQEVEGVEFKESESIRDSFTGRIFQKISEFNFPLTIRLDFSLRESPFFIDTSFIETIFPIGPYPNIAHLQAKEIMAEKIRALIIRCKGRDLFDLWFMLSKNISIDWEMVNKKMELYHKTADIKILREVVENMSGENLKNDLAKFLPLTHRGLPEKLKIMLANKLKNL